MTASLNRRLEKLEKVVQQAAAPVVRKEVVLLGCPDHGAALEVRQQFLADMNAVSERGAFVILLAPLTA